MQIGHHGSARDHATPTPSDCLLSVVVPAFNGSRELRRCLEALTTLPHRHEVLVVDDCSTENIREIAKTCGARYFRTPRNAGPASARNLGAENARGEIIVFVDSDVAVASNALQMIVEEFEAHPEIAALFGSYDDSPSCTDFWSQYKNLMHHYVHQLSRVEASTFWTGCGAIRKEAFHAVNGFDSLEYATPSIEDIDLGIRLIERGYAIRVVKRLQGKHLKRWTFRSMVYTDLTKRAVPWTRLIRQTRCVPQNLNLTWKSRISSALIGAFVFLGVVLLATFWSTGISRLVLFEGVLLTAAILSALNADLYRFFFAKRGPVFACGAILAHWLYLFYSGAAFVLCYGAGVAKDRFLSAIAYVRESQRAWLRVRSEARDSLRNEGDI